MDDILARLARLESEQTGLRRGLAVLDQEAVRSRRESTAAQDAALLSRLSPGPLGGPVGARGARFDSLPALGAPLLQRLRDDASMGAMTPGRTDTTAGYGNALDDPTFDTLVTTTIGTAYTAIGPRWEAKYILNSGTVATTRAFGKIGGIPRGVNGVNVASSSLGYLDLVFGVNASDMTIYLRPTFPMSLAATIGPMPSWLAASVRTWALPTTANVTATVTLEITNTADTVVTDGDGQDLVALVTLNEQATLQAAVADPDDAETYRWRLRVDVTKTAGSVGALPAVFAEPLLALSDDGSAPMFTPAIGAWVPGSPGYQLVSMPFVVPNIAAAATTDLQYADNAMGMPFPRVTMPWPGSIIGASYRMDGVLTAGTLAIHAVVNSASVWTPFSLTSASANNDAVAQPPFTDLFSTGDNVGMWVVTNGAFLPTTRDIICTLWVLVGYDGE